MGDKQTRICEHLSVASMRLVGVDGCRSGWVIAFTDLRESPLSGPEFGIAPTFEALLQALRGVRALVAVDIPIGLPGGAPVDVGTRRADAAARDFLGGRRRSSVFSAPARPTLQAGSYHEACGLEVRARGGGKGLSQQAFRIIPKIREADETIGPAHQEPPSDETRTWVREVHPEVTFAMLAGGGERGYGLVHSKRGCTSCRGTLCPGEFERVTLLKPYVPDFDPRAVHERLLRLYPRTTGSTGAIVGRDDIVDAVACLVTAYRIATGEAMTLPAGEPQVDERGLRMEIVS
jgi:predicted RNase H-like nuclease